MWPRKSSGFVFKIHANLDPKHRDRIAFSGSVQAALNGTNIFTTYGNDKEVRFSNPLFAFMARDKSVIEDALCRGCGGIV